MWLMGMNSYDKDIKFQSSDRPQFLTQTKCQRVQLKAPVFAGNGLRSLLQPKRLPRGCAVNDFSGMVLGIHPDTAISVLSALCDSLLETEPFCIRV